MSSLLVAAAAWLFHDAHLMAVASVILGFGYAAIDLSRISRNRMSALVLMTFFCGIAGVADLTGMLSTGKSWEREFFLYAIEEYLFEAQALTYLGTITMISGYAWAATRIGALKFLPAIKSGLAPRRLAALVTIGSLGCTALMWRGIELGGGTLGDAFRMAPATGAFFLAMLGGRTKEKRILAFAVGVALVESFRAVLFSYLRFGMVFPFLAVVLGLVIGGRSVRVLRTAFLLPIAIAVFIMAPYAGTFATARQILPTGTERLTELASTDATGTSGWVTTLSRYTTFNQTTQVMRLADSEGFLLGDTMRYWAYALIPRVLWPSKPIIAQGQWFAEKLGLGFYMRDSKTFSNSINMTLAGEWYLNFGWLGAAVGCFLAGGFVAALWDRCNPQLKEIDVLSSLLGFRLIWGAWSLLGDVQAIVTLLAYYVAFASLGWAIRRRLQSRIEGRGNQRPAKHVRRSIVREIAAPRAESSST